MTCPSGSPHLIPDYSRMTVSSFFLQSDMILMPFKNGNSSGWWVSIHRNANCYESPEINLQWRRPTWYVIRGHTLAETDTAKYLGVSLHRHSSWSPHVNATAKKANGTRAFLQRNLRKAKTTVKTRTYESLICLILEYSGVVYTPTTPKT